MMNKFGFLLIAVLILFTTSSCKDDDMDPGSTPTTSVPKISISSVTLFEGNDATVYSFRISTSAASTETITVDYTTEDVSAGEGLDYVKTTGTLTIAPGVQEAIIDVPLITDEFKEPDEQFKVVLSNAVNATIQTAEGLGTIRNDDTLVIVPEDGYITPESYIGYDLVWQDEFNGTSINPECWTHETGNNGWGNQELQYYTNRTENSFVSNGNLIIEAKKENYQGAPYTSARMITAGKKDFLWGRVDVRAILPEGQGIWPALWMLGSNIFTDGWPYCGEIDIMELVGHEPGTVHGTAHWGPQGQSFSNNHGQAYNLANSEKFSEKYHVFSIVWEPDLITYYVDDNQYFQLRKSDVSGNYPFNNNFFFIFNIAVGGTWPGNPDASTQFPQQMIVDYIRVFQ